MKKLMIAAAIVCAAAMSQAAGYRWNVIEEIGMMNLDGTAFSGDAYVFNTTYSSAMFDAWAANQSVDFTSLTDYAGTVTFADGLTSGSFNYGDTAGSYDFTMVLVDNGGNFFEADPWEGVVYSAQPAGADIGAGVDWTGDAGTRAEFTYAAADGYQGAGYYTAAVPEPTSGLLLLLGVAGMALRRRRA